MQINCYTFLTLFDSDIETRIDAQGNLIVECGPRNVRDCIVGTDREKVLAKGQAMYEQYKGAYGDDWLAIGSVNAMVESSQNSHDRRVSLTPPTM